MTPSGKTHHFWLSGELKDESRLQRSGGKGSKRKYPRRSSLWDINQRYGRPIRYPARRKKTIAINRAITGRKKRMVLWSVIIAVMLGLGIYLLLFALRTSGW
jgi:hypothetical protein